MGNPAQLLGSYWGSTPEPMAQRQREAQPWEKRSIPPTPPVDPEFGLTFDDNNAWDQFDKQRPSIIGEHEPSARERETNELRDFLQARPGFGDGGAALAMQSLEGGVQRGGNARSIWGPRRTQDSDAPWYLPESMIGDLPYRYQGVALHGLMALIPALGPGVRALNAAYAIGSHLSGRTDPLPKIEDQLPPPRAYPPGRPNFGNDPVDEYADGGSAYSGAEDYFAPTSSSEQQQPSWFDTLLSPFRLEGERLRDQPWRGETASGKAAPNSMLGQFILDGITYPPMGLRSSEGVMTGRDNVMAGQLEQMMTPRGVTRAHVRDDGVAATGGDFEGASGRMRHTNSSIGMRSNNSGYIRGADDLGSYRGNMVDWPGDNPANSDRMTAGRRTEVQSDVEAAIQSILRQLEQSYEPPTGPASPEVTKFAADLQKQMQQDRRMQQMRDANTKISARDPYEVAVEAQRRAAEQRKAQEELEAAKARGPWKPPGWQPGDDPLAALIQGDARRMDALNRRENFRLIDGDKD